MAFNSATVSVGGVTKQSDYQRIMDNTIANRDTKATVSIYKTGWINRSDWTNVHMGSDTSKNVDSNLNHGLGAPLSDLIVKVFISTDGTDANSFEMKDTGIDRASGANQTFGIIIAQVDNDNLIIQTGATGILTLATNGDFAVIDTEDWYYKIVVYKLA